MGQQNTKLKISESKKHTQLGGSVKTIKTSGKVSQRMSGEGCQPSHL